MTELVRLTDSGATIDTLLTTVKNSNLSSTHKITRSATIVVAASDSSAKSKAQADYVCDGTADNVEIQAAIATFSSIGGILHMCSGTYAAHNNILVNKPNVTIEGDGSGTKIVLANAVSSTLVSDVVAGASVIQVNDPTLFSVGDVVAVSDDNTTTLYGRHRAEAATITQISGNTITLNGNFTNGYTVAANAYVVTCPSVVHCAGNSGITIKNLYIDGNKSNQPMIQTLTMGVETEARGTMAGVSAYGCSNLTIKNVTAINSSRHNFSIDACNYPIVKGCTTKTCRDKNMLIFESNFGKFIQNVVRGSENEDGICLYSSCSNSILDGNTVTACPRYGARVVGANNIIRGNDISTCAEGLSVYNGNNDIIMGNAVYTNTQQGMKIFGSGTSSSVTIANNMATGNGEYGILAIGHEKLIVNSNSLSGNIISGIGLSECNHLTVNSNNIVGGTYGIKGTANIANVVCVGNIVSGATTNNILLTGTNILISDNNGHPTQNTGTATITAGQTTVAVTHGLVAAPTRVLLSPTTATTGKQYYVSAKAASTFTITIDSAAEADISFDWSAVI